MSNVYDGYVLYNILFQRIQIKTGCLFSYIDGQVIGGRIKKNRMGQTGSRVATKIANSFTFHGSPRFNIQHM